MEFMMRTPKSEAEALALRAEIGADALEAATLPEEACSIGFFVFVAETPAARVRADMRERCSIIYAYLNHSSRPNMRTQDG